MFSFVDALVLRNRRPGTSPAAWSGS
jgi:hypothetical protein